MDIEILFAFRNAIISPQSNMEKKKINLWL